MPKAPKKVEHRIDHNISGKPVHNVFSSQEFRLQKKQKKEKRKFEKKESTSHSGAIQTVSPLRQENQSHPKWCTKAIPSGAPLKLSQVAHLIAHFTIQRTTSPSGAF
ncbi:hypothetical protein JCGZ_25299 [Jatropha curcas]|uniref:Uncharacterized protein n=1 Tax=Jatropha curcas TaxID=180498 RepID=A0A067JXV9_JATCU|nr:hypothetical protein JCGZ_25299 [Jatropha curcas]